MESGTIPSPQLEQFYRFALLLCGDANTAEQMLSRAHADLLAQAGSMRSANARNAWLAARIRQENSRLREAGGDRATDPTVTAADHGYENSQVVEIEVLQLAQRFSTVAEPGRSALALLYLELLPVAELPALVNLSWERFCTALASAREGLRIALQQTPAAEPIEHE